MPREKGRRWRRRRRRRQREGEGCSIFNFS
jgi:hypothetical protein